MIITLSGSAGSGKSTVAKIVAKKLNYTHYSTGDYMRQMAEDRKISLLELSKIAEKDQSIDEELDQWQIDLGKKKDNFIIDGRLSFHFIPKAVKIYLYADIKEMAKRILADSIRKEHNINLKSTIKNIETRKKSEQKRYMIYYKINPYEKKHYDLVINTTKLAAEEAADKIVDYVKKLKKQ